MSDAALASAIKALADSNLDVCVELKNSRLIQQQMATTLVQIYEGQKVIAEQFEQIVQRTNTHERQQAEDRAKLRLVDEKVEGHEGRIRAIEEAARRSA